MVSAGNKAIANITASAALAGATDVKSALAQWSTINTELAANNANKAAGRLQLDTAITAEAPLVRRWGIRRRAVLSAIEIAGDGSAELVLASRGRRSTSGCSRSTRTCPEGRPRTRPGWR
jgi:hypothetical protein